MKEFAGGSLPAPLSSSSLKVRVSTSPDGVTSAPVSSGGGVGVTSWISSVADMCSAVSGPRGAVVTLGVNTTVFAAVSRTSLALALTVTVSVVEAWQAANLICVRLPVTV